MKHILFILLIGITTLGARAQNNTARPPDSLSLITQDTTADTSEAGGINAAEADSDQPAATNNNWYYGLLGGLLIGIIGAAVVLKFFSPKKTAIPQPREEDAAPDTEKGKEQRISAAEVKKLKQEIKNLSAQVAVLQGDNETLEKNLGIYRNFDSTYFGEAFRKLIVPMNEALESGSRKEIMEHLLKIMSHFSSLTRYKIAKKQPYDETNIHYLLGQKGSNEVVATEINADTPIDKIPKNIKAITDLLKEQGSKGLDDSIITGYRIKNL